MGKFTKYLNPILEKQKTNGNLLVFLTIYFRELSFSSTNSNYNVSLDRISKSLFKEFTKLIKSNNRHTSGLFLNEIVSRAIDLIEKSLIKDPDSFEIDEFIDRIKNHTEYIWALKKIENYFMNHLWKMLLTSLEIQILFKFDPVNFSFVFSEETDIRSSITQISDYLNKLWNEYLINGYYNLESATFSNEDSKNISKHEDYQELKSNINYKGSVKDITIPPLYQLSKNQFMSSSLLLDFFHDFLSKNSQNIKSFEIEEFIKELRKTQKYKNYNVNKLRLFLNDYYPIYLKNLELNDKSLRIFDLLDDVNIKLGFNFIETISEVDLNQFVATVYSLELSEFDLPEFEIERNYLLAMNALDYKIDDKSHREKTYTRNLKALNHIENFWDEYISEWEKIIDEERSIDYVRRYFHLETKNFDNNELNTIEDLKDLDYLRRRPHLIYLSLSFLKIHGNDFSVELEKFLFENLSDERKRMIVFRIGDNQTLEQVGLKFGLTRERVRQVSSKYIKFLSKKLKESSSYRLINRILSRFKTSFFVSYEEIIEHFGNLSPFILEILIRLENPFVLIKKLNGVTRHPESLEQVIEWLDAINYIESIELEENLLAISESLNEGFSINDIFSVFHSMFILRKDVYFNNKFLKKRSDKTIFVLARHFSEGIKVYNHEDINKFRNHYAAYFGHEKFLSLDTRSIGSNLTKYTKIVEKGTYAIIDEEIELDNEVIEFLKDTIMTSKLIYIERLYELTNHNFNIDEVRSRDHFARLIKKPLQNFYQNRFYYATEENFLDYQNYLTDYVKNTKRVVSNKELLEKFPGIDEKTIMNVTSIDSDIISMSNKNYISISNIPMVQKDEEIYLKILESKLSIQPFIHIRDMQRNIIFNEELTTIKDIKEDNLGLHKLLKYHLSENYQFHYPFIAHKDSFVGTTDEMADYYILNGDTIEIKKIVEFYKDLSKPLNTIEWLISKNDLYYQINSTHIQKKELININQNILNTLERLLRVYFTENLYLGIDDFKSWNLLPSINIEWNKYLLHSIIVDKMESAKIEYEIKQYNNLKYRLNWEG